MKDAILSQSWNVSVYLPMQPPFKFTRRRSADNVCKRSLSSSFRLDILCCQKFKSSKVLLDHWHYLKCIGPQVLHIYIFTSTFNIYLYNIINDMLKKSLRDYFIWRNISEGSVRTTRGNGPTYTVLQCSTHIEHTTVYGHCSMFVIPIFRRFKNTPTYINTIIRNKL